MKELWRFVLLFSVIVLFYRYLHGPLILTVKAKIYGVLYN